MLYCVGISEVSFRDMYGEVVDEGCPPFIREHVHHIQKESSGTVIHYRKSRQVQAHLNLVAFLNNV
jgi:hypothetical protein